MNQTIYISGPMSSLPNLNRDAFVAAAAKLRGLGYTVVNPAETDPPGEPTWEECMRADIRDMMACTHLALLPGWENSRGATLEVHIAEALGMTVLGVGDYGVKP